MWAIWGKQRERFSLEELKFFVEQGVFAQFIRIMALANQPSPQCEGVMVQLLQTLNLMIQNLKSEKAIYYMFSKEHINNVISFPFDFSDEELLAYYISFLKTLSMKLDKSTISYFIVEKEDGSSAFPLYVEAIRFFHHEESMVRIAVRTLTLTIYNVHDERANRFVLSPSAIRYFEDLAIFVRQQSFTLARLVANAVRNFGSIVDVGRVEASIAEIGDLLYYCNDVMSAGIPQLSEVVSEHLLSNWVFPVLLASLSPESGSPNAKRISPLCAMYLLSRVLHVVTYRPFLDTATRSIAASLSASPAGSDGVLPQLYEFQQQQGKPQEKQQEKQQEKRQEKQHVRRSRSASSSADFGVQDSEFGVGKGREGASGGAGGAAAALVGAAAAAAGTATAGHRLSDTHHLSARPPVPPPAHLTTTASASGAQGIVSPPSAAAAERRDGGSSAGGVAERGESSAADRAEGKKAKWPLAARPGIADSPEGSFSESLEGREGRDGGSEEAGERGGERTGDGREDVAAADAPNGYVPGREEAESKQGEDKNRGEDGNRSGGTSGVVRSASARDRPALSARRHLRTQSSGSSRSLTDSPQRIKSSDSPQQMKSLDSPQLNESSDAVQRSFSSPLRSSPYRKQRHASDTIILDLDPTASAWKQRHASDTVILDLDPTTSAWYVLFPYFLVFRVESKLPSGAHRTGSSAMRLAPSFTLDLDPTASACLPPPSIDRPPSQSPAPIVSRPQGHDSVVPAVQQRAVGAGMGASRDTIVSYLLCNNERWVLASLCVLCGLLQNTAVHDSLLEELGMLPCNRRHRRLLVEALVGNQSEEQLKRLLRRQDSDAVEGGEQAEAGGGGGGAGGGAEAGREADRLSHAAAEAPLGSGADTAVAPAPAAGSDAGSASGLSVVDRTELRGDSSGGECSECGSSRGSGSGRWAVGAGAGPVLGSRFMAVGGGGEGGGGERVDGAVGRDGDGGGRGRGGEEKGDERGGGGAVLDEQRDRAEGKASPFRCAACGCGGADTPSSKQHSRKRRQVVDTVFVLLCKRPPPSPEALWHAGWLLRQLLPPSHRLQSAHKKLLTHAYELARGDLVGELLDCWCDMLPAAMVEEWKACRKALESATLANDSSLVLMPSLPPLLTDGDSSSAAFGERMRTVVKVYVALHQMRATLLGLPLPDVPPLATAAPPLLDARFGRKGLNLPQAQEGTEVPLEPGDAIPCRVAFERGKEKHVLLLVASSAANGWVLLAEPPAGMTAKAAVAEGATGVVRVVAPLAGCQPSLDPKHKRWLHLRIRSPQAPASDADSSSVKGLKSLNGARCQSRVVAMATKKKVNTYLDDWRKEFIGYGIFVEDSESAPVNIVQQLEKKKLLSQVEKAGLLSKLESSGLTLSKIEELGLLSKAESLGLLSLAEKFATTPAGTFASAALPLLVAAIAVPVLVPDDSAALVIGQLTVASLLALASVTSFTLSLILGILQE
ncbi:unnamed protein product [Closterium sp. NIES-64]|nr:unnamed protein product [Closterium sp. NIES-64]